MLVNLKDSAGNTAVITTDGAQLMSQKNAEGVEYLWQRDPKYWAGCAPILFPCVGGLRGDKTRIGGTEYTMGRHGFARYGQFEATQTAENEAVLVLRATEATKAENYPFDFELQAAFKLENAVLATTFTVSNRGGGDMPFVVGGHPAFNVPLHEGESFEDYSMIFEKKETQVSPTIRTDNGEIDFSLPRPVLSGENVLPLRHSLFDGDALIFSGLNSKSLRIESKAGHGVEMEFGDFSMMGVWSASNNAPFVALEPWTGCGVCTDEGDDFEKKRGMRLLPAGESAAYTFTTRIY